VNTPQVPSVELIQEAPKQVAERPPRWRRWKVFLGVLLTGSLIGIAIVYGRDPLYRASVSVLTVKPKAVDARSEAADTEHVAIQGRLLLGEDILGRLGSTLSAENDTDFADVETLRGMLSAVSVPDTNLLELRSEGSDPELLQKMANRWAETYKIFRAEEIEAATGRTTAELMEQQSQLQIKIDAARAELLEFRATNDIVSLERNENRNLSRLKGLNDSLNKARERLIDAQAKYAAIQDAVAKGETVVPREFKADLARKQLEVERLRDRIMDLNSKYTQRYLDRDPKLKALPDELRELERDLKRAIHLGQRTMIDEAQQELGAARAAVATLEKELSEHQSRVQVFTDRFKEFKSMEESLARLETLRSDIGERLAKIQVQNLKEYPPIQVVDWASVPARPIYPDYERDLFIALGAALTLALFATWLLEYLIERSNAPATSPMAMRIYLNEARRSLETGAAPSALAHGMQAGPSLAHEPASPEASTVPATLPESAAQLRELTLSEIRALLESSDPVTAGYCTLLLSGVSPLEITLIHRDSIDHNDGIISVPGISTRDIEMGPGAWGYLRDFALSIAEHSTDTAPGEINATLAVAAADAGIDDPFRVDVDSIWYSYVLYLVRQGARLSELPERVGALTPDMQLILAHFSPPGVNRPLSEVNRVHPSLA